MRGDPVIAAQELGPILTKSQMYRLLQAGSFGNTIRNWRNLGEWERSTERTKYQFWEVH
jgi:hypothetical protein